MLPQAALEASCGINCKGIIRRMGLHFRRDIVMLLLFVLGCGLAACQAGDGINNSVTPGFDLTPYQTATPSLTLPPPTPAGTDTPTPPPPTVPPPPTPTPFLHTIAEGDTLLAIALRYGVTVEDIQAANPEVNPNLLVVGTQVIIPIPLDGSSGDVVGGTPQAIATPTPVAVELAEPVCYPQADGGLWCLALVGNESGRTLENVSGWISLQPAQGEASGLPAVTPLNILAPGAVLPLAVYFPPPAPQDARVAFELLAALPVAEGDRRYATTELEIESVEIMPGGLEAVTRGQVRFPLPPAATITPTSDPTTPTVTPSPTLAITGTPIAEGSTPAARLVWLALVAYDDQGEVVGLRKWEAQREIPFGGSLPFEVTVYSLGPPIDHMQVLVEARP